MKKLGFDLSHLNYEDKLQRNIQIGLMMRKNPRLTSLLRNTTRSVIDEFIKINNITDEDIILRQYDGIIITKTLKHTDTKHIPLNMRKHFLVFISSIDRQKYITITSKRKTIIKGVPHRFDEMDKFYFRICNIVDIGRKESIFRHLQRLKDDMMTSQNPKLFAIPSRDKKFNIFLKGYGQLEVSKAALKIMDPEDIDKERYFKFYIEPFTKSIVVEYVR